MADDRQPRHLKEKLEHEKPPYVEDVSGTGDPDIQPDVGTDPMDAGEAGQVHKTIVAPDPEKVRQAEREGKGL